MASEDRDFTAGTNISQVGFPGNFVSTVDRSFLLDPACGAPGTDSAPSGTGEDLRCTFNFNPHVNLITEEERVLGLVNAEHDITDHFTAFAEIGFARSQTIAVQSPSLPTIRTVFVPADHPDNPFVDETTGEPIATIFLGRPKGREAGSSTTIYKLKGLRLVGGVRGDFEEAGRDTLVEDWEYELAMTWHENHHLTASQDTLLNNIQSAINSCSDPLDRTPCFNPFYSSIDGTGTPNTAEAMDFIEGQIRVERITRLTAGDARIGGPLFELPGGDVGFVVGGQWRQEFASVDMDDQSNAREFLLVLGGDDYVAKRDVFAAYTEVMIPPVTGMEIQAAIRAEHYVDFDTSASPKIGLSWSPFLTFEGDPALHGWRLRGSFSTAFRAPNLLQQKGSLTSFAQFQDPGPVFRAEESSGNPDLGPETARATSAGMEYLYEGFGVEADFWHYDYSDIIVRQNGQALLSICQGDPSSPACGSIIRDPFTGALLSVNTTYINATAVQTAGIDFGASYRFEIEPDHALRFGAAGTYTLYYDIPREGVADIPVTGGVVSPPNCDGDSCDVAGKRNFTTFARPLPRLRMKAPIDWTPGNHSVTFVTNFISGYDNDDPVSASADGSFDAIDAWVTFDFSYGYRLVDVIGTETLFRVGIVNVADADPPAVANTSYGYDIFTHDPRGRMFYGRLTHHF